VSQCDPNNPCDDCKAQGLTKSVLHVDAPVDKPEPIIVRQTSGPFKGRIYERMPGGGLKRRLDLEVADARERKRKMLEELHKQTMQGGRRGGKRIQEVSLAEFHQAVRRS
jgi:hypothetical protein